MAVAAKPVHFAEAIDYLRRKLLVGTRAWTDVWQDAHALSFMVAGAMQEALVGDFHAAVTRAIAEGRTLADFRKDFDAIVERHGWSYKGGRGWRSRVIFETNVNSAYSAGRFQQAQRLKAQRPYLRYVHMDPNLTQEDSRHEHAAWHGIILPVDDPFWKTHMTPNGWGCRCKVQSLSARDLARYGFSVSKSAPEVKMVERRVNTPDGPATVKVPFGIDPGFAWNPGDPDTMPKDIFGR
ncbi:MAG: phage minor head protein [Parvibaculum sp.]|uniref:phage head morphogenesis protein n=1 Tax=Parvibaculum sp. TaxID=2024848 RepID=UPI002719B7FC|nr:phage minor head protein [Parvibaculum sp.]MDO8838010.1 phage minor head protein [Parvibaculum sp.]